MHGGAGTKNWYASRRVESDVGPRRDGRGHSEGSAVTLAIMCNLYSITTNQAAIHRAVPRHQPLCRQPRADARASFFSTQVQLGFSIVSQVENRASWEV